MITLKNIHKTFGKKPYEVHAIRGADLNIEKGEAVAIFGPSGSGKTTLLEIIGVLSKITIGEYFIGNENVSLMKDSKKAYLRNSRFGFVFQTFNLIPDMTVYHNVEVPLQYSKDIKGKKKDLIKAAIESVSLSHKCWQVANKLSGGEKQRASIARAIVLEPDIILADEPTGNLDSENGKIVIDLLMDFWKRGKTLILITHNESLAKKFPRILKIFDGKITYDGPPENFI
ncbi:MAG: ABC transporter ATP-binding protein [Candidatus Aureabacteria bacterium]|nr:ABC transporter ATP-binding protein [Candidatus Auribacterota bacterium]